MSTLANVVFAFNIAVPIHTMFRSCNIIASVALGWTFFGQKYTARQVLCVVTITVGILLASYGDAQAFVGSSSCTSNCAATSTVVEVGSGGFGRWSIGVAILVCVQVLQATLGHTQAVFYKRDAHKAPKDQLADEFLFTAHVGSLLMIPVLWDDITHSVAQAQASAPFSPLFPIPRNIVYMAMNNLTQLCCIKGVFRLAANFSPLTVNIALSVRKFLSVVLSATWFGNPWTHLHSIATVAIFGGVFAYAQSSGPAAPAKKSE